MPTFDTGVSGYIRGVCEVEVFFPIDHKGNKDVRCAQCDYFISKTRKCALNGALCNYPEKFLGERCPLYFPDEPIMKKGE